MKSRLIVIALVVALTAGVGCESEEADDDPAQQQQQADDQSEADDQPDEQDDEEAGLDLENMHRLDDRQIITSAQPEEDDFEALAEEGVELVVNLREIDEAGFFDGAAKGDEVGISYVHIPVDPEEGLTEENVEQLDDALDATDGEALVHCGTAERAGALLALRGFWIEEMDEDEALELGASAGLDALEDTVVEAME